MLLVDAPQARGASTTARMALAASGARSADTEQPGPNRTARTHRGVRAKCWYQRERTSGSI